MPGKAEYWYVLRLDSEQALKQAEAFAKAVQQQMKEIRTTANIVLKATVDTSATKKAVKTEAQKVAAEYKKALGTAQRDFATTTSRAGAQQFTQGFRSMWEEGTINPSAEAVQGIRKAESAVAALGKTAKTMGVSTDDLVDMGGVDRAITAVQSVQRRMWGLRGLGYQLESYGRSMTMTATAMGAAAAAASNEYLKFADPLGRAARNLDLNSELTGVLDKRLTELAGTVSMMSPREQAEGLYLWAAATGAVVDSETELNNVLTQADHVQRLAKLGNVSYGVAVEATTDILSQYQLNISETERVVGTLIKVAAVSKAEVGDLAQAFSFAGARADQANTTFEETAAAFQLLSAFGLRGSRAGRGFAMLMENLIAPSEKARGELDALFGSVFGRTDVLETAEGQFVGMAEAINILAEATSGLTEMRTQEIVANLTSQNASRALVPLLKLETQAREQGISAIEATANILEGQVGAQERAFVALMEAQTGYEMSTESSTATAERYWTQLAESMVGQAEFMKARFAGAVGDIGREMTIVLLPVMREAAEIASKLAAYTSEHPNAAKAVVGAVAIVGLAGLLTTAVGKGIRLVADVKTLAMATSLYNTATRQIEAAALQMAASENQIRAAGMQITTRPALPGPVGAGMGLGRAGSILGSVGAVVGVAAALALVYSEMKRVDDEHREEASLIAATTDSYADYVEAMEDAGEGKYALTEATYALLEAERERGKFADSEAEKERAKELLRAQDNMEAAIRQMLKANKGWAFVTSGQMEEGYGEQVKEAVANMGELERSLLRQRDLVAEVAASSGITAPGMAEYLAQMFELEAMYESVAGEEAWQSMRPPEDLVSEALLVAEAQGEIEEKTRAAAAAAAAAKVTWDDWLETMGTMDSALSRTRDGILEVIAALRLLPGTEGAISALEAKLSGIEGSMETMRFEAIGHGIEEGAKLGVASLEDLAAAAESAAESGFGMFEGLADYMPNEAILANYQTYLEEMDQTYKEAALMGERAGQLHILRWQQTWDDWADSHKEAQDQITRDAEQAQKDREQFLKDAQSGFEGLVRDALKPTDVTDLDMLDTALGNYADKWDEQARRMKAALADPMNEWRASMIPADVLAGGEDAIQAFGKRWLDSFYKGMNPDAIDWPAFVQSFKDNLAAATAQENLLQIAIGELAAAGITATSDEVLAALGLQSPIQQMFLGGLSTKAASDSLSGTMGSVVSGMSIEDGAFDTAAGTVKAAFDTSLTGKLAEMNLPSTLNSAWTKQIADTPDPIISVGRMAGALFWQGFEGSVAAGGLIDTVVGIVMEEILAAIEAD